MLNSLPKERAGEALDSRLNEIRDNEIANDLARLGAREPLRAPNQMLENPTQINLRFRLREEKNNNKTWKKAKGCSQAKAKNNTTVGADGRLRLEWV